MGYPLNASHTSFGLASYVLGSSSSLQNLNPLHSLASSPNSTCRARIFLSSKSRPSSPCSCMIRSSSFACILNNSFKSIIHPSPIHILYKINLQASFPDPYPKTYLYNAHSLSYPRKEQILILDHFHKSGQSCV